MPCAMENSQLMEHIGTIKINPKYLDMQLPPNSPDRTFGHLRKNKSSIFPLQICSRLMLTIPPLNRCFPRLWTKALPFAISVTIQEKQP